MIPNLRYPRTVRRLRVRWREGTWEIERETLVPAMTLPLPAELPEGSPRGLAGLWYELTDSDGKALYRSIIPERLLAPAEVFHEDGTMSRPGPLPSNIVVDVLLPVVPEGDELRIFAGQSAAGRFLAADARALAHNAQATEIARLTLAPVQGGPSAGPEGGSHGPR